MLFDPSLTSLRALRSLAKTGNVSLTATELRLTQSAVSRSISNLENMIGLTLVQRAVRPLKLTKEGEIVASHANDINQSIIALGERLSELKHNKLGSVRIGSFGASASTRILPPLIKAFAKTYPAISVNIIEANDAQTFLNLQRGHVDLAFLTDPGEDYETIPIDTDQLIAIVPENSALAKYDVLKPADLMHDAFIMTLGGSEHLIRQWFDQADAEPKITHHVYQTHSILALVSANLGNAIVAGLSLPQSTAGVSQVPLFQTATNSYCFGEKISNALF